MIQSPSEEVTPLIHPTASIEDLIKTNGDCRLPCFWGISPGVTKWIDAMTLFKQKDINWVIGLSSQNHEYLTALIEQNDFSILLNLYRLEDYVGAVFITITNEPSLRGIRPGHIGYSLRETFANLGEPTDLFFMLELPPEGPSANMSYSFWLNFEEDGLLLDYIGTVEESNGPVVCPEQTFEQLVLYLSVPGSHFLPWGTNIYQPRGLEKVTEFTTNSIADIYQSTLRSIDPVCIHLNP